MDDNTNNQPTEQPNQTKPLDESVTNTTPETVQEDNVVEAPEPEPEIDSDTQLTDAVEEGADNQKPSNETGSKSEAPAAVISDSGKSKKPKIILIALVVVLLAVLGYLGYKAFYNKDTPTKTAKVVVVKKDIPVLNVSVNPTPINSFYPSEEQFQSPNYLINSQIYEGLVKFDDISKIKPSLASSWTNPDEETWVFTLKKGVKFHDGNTMTANDVKTSLETYPDKAYGGLFTFSAKKIEVVNDNQIKITTNGPDPLLLHKLAYLAIVDSKNTNKAGELLSGTGPYVVKSDSTPSETNVDLVAFSKYHGGHVYTKELNFTAVDEDATQIDALINSKADYANGFAAKSEIDKLSSKSNVTLVAQEGLGSSYFGVNHTNTKSPLANLKVRQAINLAFNRQEIIKASDLSATESGQIVTKEVPGYNSSIKPVKQDVEKAKQLLTEAGYPSGFTYSLAYVSGLADKQANEIAKQLKVIGITTKLDPQKDFTAYNTKWDSGQLDAFIEGYTSDLFDASDVYSFMVNDNPYYSNKQVSDLLDKAGSTLDQNKRLAYLQQASKELNDDLNVIPTYIVNLPYAYKSSLAVEPGIYSGPYFWQVYQK